MKQKLLPKSKLKLAALFIPIIAIYGCESRLDPPNLIISHLDLKTLITRF